jgi:hypothetical protein
MLPTVFVRCRPKVSGMRRLKLDPARSLPVDELLFPVDSEANGVDVGSHSSFGAGLPLLCSIGGL